MKAPLEKILATTLALGFLGMTALGGCGKTSMSSTSTAASQAANKKTMKYKITSKDRQKIDQLIRKFFKAHSEHNYEDYYSCFTTQAKNEERCFSRDVWFKYQGSYSLYELVSYSLEPEEEGITAYIRDKGEFIQGSNLAGGNTEGESFEFKAGERYDSQEILEYSLRNESNAWLFYRWKGLKWSLVKDKNGKTAYHHFP